MYNQITLVGRWTRDTEVKMTQNGTEVLNGSLAVSDPYKKEHTDFIDIVAFKQLALNTNQYTKKGSKVLVSGKLQQERWENNEGQKRSRHVVIANQVVFLDDIKQQNNQQNTATQQQQPQSNPFQGEGEQLDIGDDDLPF